MTESPAGKLAIFDHDGVLVDTLALHQESWVALGRAFGLSITPEFIARTFGMTNPAIFRELLGDAVAPEQVAAYGEHKERCYREAARDVIALMPGVRELLDALSARGFALAIGSSATRPNLDLTVERCGLEGRFRSIAGLEDIDRGKPDPQVFLVAAERAGVPPGRAVVFEDAPVGIRAAKAAGMLAVGVGSTVGLDALREAGADFAYPTVESVDLDAIEARLSGG